MKPFGQTTVSLNLRVVDCEHLLSLLKDNYNEGSYYGNAKHYWNRADRIKAALMEAIVHAAQIEL